MTLRARDIIKLEYHDSTNFMTPHIMRYGKIGRGEPELAYEISRGEFLDTPIFGLSIVQYLGDDKTIRRVDLSKSFQSMDKLEEYLKALAS